MANSSKGTYKNDCDEQNNEESYNDMNEISLDQTFVKLNEDIKEHFSHITTIKPSYKLSFEGVSRLVMLDRYSQKDNDLVSLGIGDLVLTVIKDDPFFPTRGIGRVHSFSDEWVLIEVEEQFIGAIDKKKEELIDGNLIKRKKGEVQKPLEIFFEQIANRVAKAISKMEETRQEEFEEKFFEQISNLKLVPAGRILYGAGSTSKVTFFNCFVLPFIHDSRKGIAKHREEAMEIMSRGGGVGTNGSTLRPKNAVAKSVGGHSSGTVSWLNDLTKLTHLIQQGGSRRGAQMIMLSDWHPDVIEFIVSKMQKPEILKYLKNNAKDPQIRKSASNKLKFKPLDNSLKIAYENLLNNDVLRSTLSDVEVKRVKALLEGNGEYEIVDVEQLNGANISIAISDKFMEAVDKDEIWEFKYPDIDNYSSEDKAYYDQHWSKCGNIFEWEQVHKKQTRTHSTIKARVLWDLINFCATYSAEPGLFFLDRANTFTNAKSYGQKVIATNPCGEQPLPPYAVCNLGAVNLDRFVDRCTKDVLWSDLEETIRVAVRFQDNITDATPYFLKANEEMAKKERRVGIGVMGLHDLLIWAGYEYGSNESLELINKLFNFICETAYDESSNIALEKGEFPYLEGNREKFVEGEFVKQLSQKVRAKILAQGIRNSHLLTIAPTGTTGTMVGVSTGLEPYFAFKYYRSGRLGEYIEVNAKIVDDYMKIHNIDDDQHLPNIFISANKLTPEQHVNVQTTIQKWVDSAISKTVNAPKGYTVRQVEKIYSMLYKNNAKGGTVYVDGSRSTQVLTLTDDEELFEQPSFEEVTNADASNEYEINEETTYRANRQDKPIGIEEGNICPLCLEGTIVQAGGCNTCTNCQAQLKCGL